MTRSVVTGSSSGIGLATAVRLATAGHQVVATMRNPDAADDLRAAARSAGIDDTSITVVALDVDDDASVEAAVGRILTDLGPIDVLVNNAGTSPVAAVEDMPIDAWKRLFETNVFGVVRCSQAVLPSMRARRSGHIITISSVAGRTTTPMFGPYSASKWAVEALIETLAIEAAVFGIRVSLIEPGAIATPIRAKTGAPDRNSPYRPVAKNWGFAVGHDHAQARGPEEVAEAIAEVVADPQAPFRTTVGVGIDEMIALRSRHDDEEWIDLWSADTSDFLDRYRQLTGIDLVPGQS